MGTILAELEVRHSRPLAPTRRVALGTVLLPTGRRAWAARMLLRGVVAAFVDRLTPDELGDFDRLLDDLGAGRVSQPRLGYRFQTDVHGLDVSRHRLVSNHAVLEVEVDRHGDPVPQVLAACYASAALGAIERLPQAARGTTGWALDVLGLPHGVPLSAAVVQRRFRTLLRQAHPDHGADAAAASRRITELAAARRILLEGMMEAGRAS